MAENRGAESREALNVLEITTRKQGTTVTIEVAGEWDLAGSLAARQATAGALIGCPEWVVLDLSRLGFIDASGLHATIELARRSRAQNVRLVIIPGPPAVQRVFELAGLTGQLRFIDKPLPGGAARSRSALVGVAGSGGSSLPANGTGRRSKAAGAAPATGTPPTRAASSSPRARRQRPVPAQRRSHLSAVLKELAHRKQTDP